MSFHLHRSLRQCPRNHQKLHLGFLVHVFQMFPHFSLIRFAEFVMYCLSQGARTFAFAKLFKNRTQPLLCLSFSPSSSAAMRICIPIEFRHIIRFARNSDGCKSTADAYPFHACFKKIFLSKTCGISLDWVLPGSVWHLFLSRFHFVVPDKECASIMTAVCFAIAFLMNIRHRKAS